MHSDEPALGAKPKHGLEESGNKNVPHRVDFVDASNLFAEPVLKVDCGSIAKREINGLGTAATGNGGREVPDRDPLLRTAPRALEREPLNLDPPVVIGVPSAV